MNSRDPDDARTAGEAVTLDETGYRMLAALEGASSQDRTLMAAVHRARAEIAAKPALAQIPFADVVSAVARVAALPLLLDTEDDARRDGGAADPGPPSLRLDAVVETGAGKWRR